MEKVYKELSSSIATRLRCITRRNFDPANSETYVINHTKKIEKIIREYLPHGCGINDGYDFDYDHSTGEKLVINSSYHCIDNNGFYVMKIPFTIIVTPSLLFDFKLKISGTFGKKKNTKEYLYNLFSESFNILIE